MTGAKSRNEDKRSTTPMRLKLLCFAVARMCVHPSPSIDKQVKCHDEILSHALITHLPCDQSRGFVIGLGGVVLAFPITTRRWFLVDEDTNSWKKKLKNLKLLFFEAQSIKQLALHYIDWSDKEQTSNRARDMNLIGPADIAATIKPQYDFY